MCVGMCLRKYVCHQRRSTTDIMEMLGLPARIPLLPAECESFPRFFCSYSVQEMEESGRKGTTLLRRPGDASILPVVVVIDETYLLKKYVAGKSLDGAPTVVGGVFDPSAALDKSRLPLGHYPQEDLATLVQDILIKRVDSSEIVPLSSIPNHRTSCTSN